MERRVHKVMLATQEYKASKAMLGQQVLRVRQEAMAFKASRDFKVFKVKLEMQGHRDCKETMAYREM
jgi:hypothetical protein